MGKFRVLVERKSEYSKIVTEEKWFEVEAEDDDEAMSAASDAEYDDRQGGISKGWDYVDEEEEFIDSESECLEVEDISDHRNPDLPGQLKMFED